MGSQHPSLLRQIPLFAAVPEKTLTGLRTTTRMLAAGETLFSMGDPAGAAYVAVTGRLKIVRLADSDGRELLLDIVGPGAILGELAMFRDAPRSASIVALTESELISIDRRDFLEVVRSHSDLAITLLSRLAEKVRTLTATLEESSFLELSARLARRLLDLSRRFGVATAGGLTLDVPLSQQDLARLLGVSREAVNKQLRQWESLGTITLRRGRVSINDLAWLNETAGLGSPGS
jgi:CRP/FNR family cyclic AMP-dependent transcriptional regulator